MCVHFVTCPKQGLELKAVVLHRVGFLAYVSPKQGQDFKPSVAPLYPNMVQVPPPGGSRPSFFRSEVVHVDDFKVNCTAANLLLQNPFFNL